MTANINAVSEPDEDIIELTDVIEQGAPPVAATSVASMDNHLSDLMYADADKNPDEESEDDLDALLAEIGAAPQAMPKSAASAPDQHPVNPDETLDMPDMREVEDLLDELNIPPQPSVSADIAVAEPDAGSPGGVPDQNDAHIPAAPAASTDTADELDAILDGIAAPPAAPTQPTTPAEELDELLDSIAAVQAADAPGSELAVATPDPADDLDALLDGAAPSIPPVQVEQPIENVDAPFDGIASPNQEATAPADPAADFSGAVNAAASPLPDAAVMAPQIFEPASVEHEIPYQTPSVDDLDAFLENMPSIPLAKADEMLNSLTGQPTSETDSAASDSIAAAETEAVPLSSADMPPESLVTAEIQPLPRQWENLLGDYAEVPRAQAPENASKVMEERILSTLHTTLEKMERRINALEERIREPNAIHVPQSFMEQMERVEKRLTELSATATPLSATTKLETRIQVLENTADAVPDAAEAEAISAFNAALENIKQRFDILEGSVQAIHTAQTALADSDNQARQEREKLWQSVEERFGGIAARLDKMENGAKEELERAAAAAAARILREELAAVFSEATE